VPFPDDGPSPTAEDDPIVTKQKAVQDDLRAAGCDPGPSDGWPGNDTLVAMTAYRRQRGV
jgi:hypothetical protein